MSLLQNCRYLRLRDMYRYFLFLIIPLFLAAEPLKVDILAPAAVLINADTGAILYEKEAHARHYPGSITKMASALYILEKKKDLEELITVTRDSLAMVANSDMRISQSCLLQTDGTMMGLKVGEILTLRTLMYGLMLVSGNDAANVIGKHVSGSVEKFVSEMNHFLRVKGIKNTSFSNPHGLHHQDHWSTAYDMAMIAKEALKNPFFREVVKTTTYTRPATNKQKSLGLIQFNRLLKKGKLYYPKAIGVKTGYTDPAGHTLCAAAEHEGRVLIAAVLGYTTAEAREARYRDTTKLFEAAFAQKPVKRTLFSQEHDHFWLKLAKGKTALEAALGEDFQLSYYPAEEPVFKTEIKWDAPSSSDCCRTRGDHLRLVSNKGECITSASLYAVSQVDKTLWGAFTDLCASHRIILISFALCLFVVALLLYLLKKPKKVA